MIRKRYHYLLFPVIVVVIVSSLFLTTVQANTKSKKVPMLTKEELKTMLGNSDLVILDARTGRDWKSSEFKIKDAVRADPNKLESWHKKYAKDTRLVLYCA